jgi:hypothetical protein
LDECRYYARLEDRRYRVALPEGEYALGFFPRNRYASPLPSYRIRVIREDGVARLETVRLPLPGASAVMAVKTALSRLLPGSWKRMLTQVVLLLGTIKECLLTEKRTKQRLAAAGTAARVKFRADVPSAAKRRLHSLSKDA